jgi:hypothetical protein
MRKQYNILTVLVVLTIFPILSITCNYQAPSNNELEDLKNNLFNKSNDISQHPIYADPPTADYEDFKKGIFRVQADSITISKIKKYKDELEPLILERIDSGYSWVYLAAFLKYESAVPEIKRSLLKCDSFYMWEGGWNYSEIDAYLSEMQYPFQMAYISAIEYITSNTIEQSITLTQKEHIDLKSKAASCTTANIDSLDFHAYCSARWLLRKLKRE